MALDVLSDHDLLSETLRLVGSEREMTAALVARLAEIEERRLDLREGYSSLFEFCLKRLRLSVARRPISSVRTLGRPSPPERARLADCFRFTASPEGG